MLLETLIGVLFAFFGPGAFSSGEPLLFADFLYGGNVYSSAPEGVIVSPWPGDPAAPTPPPPPTPVAPPVAPPPPQVATPIGWSWNEFFTGIAAGLLPPMFQPQP